MHMVKVKFIPQAWVGDYAISVDPEGPTEWLVSAKLLKGVKPCSTKADELKFHHKAPKWVRQWRGPFEITWDTEQVTAPKPGVPRILIAVSGGVVQGVRSTVPIDVQVWDAEDLKAEGMSGDERDNDWEKKAEAYPVAAF